MTYFLENPYGRSTMKKTSRKRYPTWHQQAEELEIDYIILVYGKAEGFVFCPRNLEKPFRVGGDYDGNWHVTAEGALHHYERFFNKYFLDRVKWFMPYVKMISEGIDFSLDDLKLDKREVRIIQGSWPW